MNSKHASATNSKLGCTTSVSLVAQRIVCWVAHALAVSTLWLTLNASSLAYTCMLFARSVYGLNHRDDDNCCYVTVTTPATTPVADTDRLNLRIVCIRAQNKSVLVCICNFRYDERRTPLLSPVSPSPPPFPQKKIEGKKKERERVGKMNQGRSKYFHRYDFQLIQQCENFVTCSCLWPLGFLDFATQVFLYFSTTTFINDVVRAYGLGNRWERRNFSPGCP